MDAVPVPLLEQRRHLLGGVDGLGDLVVGHRPPQPNQPYGDGHHGHGDDGKIDPVEPAGEQALFLPVLFLVHRCLRHRTINAVGSSREPVSMTPLLMYSPLYHSIDDEPPSRLAALKASYSISTLIMSA